MEEIKIINNFDEDFEYDIAFSFSGISIMFDPEKTSVLFPGHVVYKKEYDDIIEALNIHNKQINDIKEMQYVCGMRAPYHLEQRGFLDCPCSTVDGYVVKIKLK